MIYKLTLRPFPDIIPLPSPIPSRLPHTAISATEFKSSESVIKSLDLEASHTQNTSVRLERTLKDLQHLLNSEDLTDM